jgi:hypothetical protein
MAILLQIIEQNQTVGLSLSGNVTGITGYTYFPQTAKKDALTGEYLPIEETVELILTGTQLQIRAAFNALESMCERAFIRTTKLEGLRIYIEYKQSATDGVWRSELLGGDVEWSENPGYRQLRETVTKAKVNLTWTRKGYWEGAEVEARLSSLANISAGVGGRLIRNCYDITPRGNWLSIAASAITGVIQTPAKILLTNASGGAKNYRNFYLSNNWEMAQPNFFYHQIEGEDAISGGTIINSTSAVASNSKYINGTFLGNTGGFLLPLTSFTLNPTAGRRFKLFARFIGYQSLSSIYVQPIIKEAEGVLAVPGGKGDITLLPASTVEWLDLGAISLPPGGYNTNWADHTLYLSIRSATSAIVNLDFVQITPLDSFRHLVQPGMQIANGDSIQDDGILGQAYSVEGGKNHAIIAARGKPLMLYPGKQQQIIINHDQGSTYDVASALTVRIWYRPRRITV